jgi:DNA processing protein
VLSEHDRAILAAAALLPGVGPARLWALLAAGPLMDSWQRLVSGGGIEASNAPSKLCAEWAAAARSMGPIGQPPRLPAQTTLLCWGDPHHPALAAGDPCVSPLLFVRSDSVDHALERRPRVGLVGTRRPTRAGLAIARQLAAELGANGISVVSGLARGVDGAAHAEAVRTVDGAPPIAVVGSGVDVVYPSGHRELWGEVVRRGAVVSEYPPGTQPVAWRFPARNRVIVAFCDVLVVVESREVGGSLITAGLAGERGVPVLAVPGSLFNEASAGTNQLLFDGCGPCRGIDDVLESLPTALRLAAGDSSAKTPTLPFGVASGGVEPSGTAAAVLDAVGWDAVTMQCVVERSGLTFQEVASALAILERSRRIEQRGGRFERCH